MQITQMLSSRDSMQMLASGKTSCREQFLLLVVGLEGPERPDLEPSRLDICETLATEAKTSLVSLISWEASNAKTSRQGSSGLKFTTRPIKVFSSWGHQTEGFVVN
jgi:hypothetical protein